MGSHRGLTYGWTGASGRWERLPLDAGRDVAGDEVALEDQKKSAIGTVVITAIASSTG